MVLVSLNLKSPEQMTLIKVLPLNLFVFYKFYSALDSEYEPPSDVLAHTVDNLWIKVYGPESVCVCVCVCVYVCVCVCVGLTCCFGFRTGAGWHTCSCAEPLTQVRWIVGVCSVLGGHVMATITTWHLFQRDMILGEVEKKRRQIS